MIWSCFFANGTVALHAIEGIMNRAMYQDILEQNLISSANKINLERRWMFQQVNNPKCTGKINQEGLAWLRLESH